MTTTNDALGPGDTCPTCGQEVRPTAEEREYEIQVQTALHDSRAKREALRMRFADFYRWVKEHEVGGVPDEDSPWSSGFLGGTCEPETDPLALWLHSAGCLSVTVSYRTVRWVDFEGGPGRTRKLPRWARRFTRALDTLDGHRGQRAVLAADVVRVLDRVRPVFAGTNDDRAW